ncbi:ammonium transporter [Mesorhizobium mediterraneum]|uniref:Ammonium transporter n=1 Tax=Mesorhizobium mediterraneum TaxID=43617 RepID=A0AB36RCB8_9HYPH|nr:MULTISPECIES: ammonium transporter [Mesorhizobium]RUU18176.1 ammonium transporter [Mesorhizobium sp. M6A.T.Ca.TU.002.02.2.1]AZO65444.1 ammonium transporter [Mesorhizobium sp. M6A.T.Cr.TU.016.01.1.1]PAQ02309.1 ammonia channel protein [Mesorhizobium mediterraneum]RUU25841.1 ammonium transporter [Mesorhizobium sp. M6A.T.Ce.TU.016.01.1.1]RUU27456.1 ammonium transporter [Mesorhizobium sp. M6A.T.Ce.TU.002.03.1.1]
MNIPSTLKSAARTALLGAFTLGALGTIAAFAQEAAPAAPAAPAVPAFTVDKGDTTWMMISTILVLLMTIPGLALFYGGLVRAKNMLSVLMQVFTITSVVMIVWVFYGYSLAFTPGNAFIGGLSKMFLAGVDVTTLSETFTKGVAIPELVFVIFQMSFACITPALIVGAFAERIKFSAVILFTILWVTFVYFPIAHMVWFWGGPSAYSDPSGLIFSFGAIDFAGGTVVHINAGIAGLVGALMVGKRIGYNKDVMAPHSMTLTMVGASLLWVGWFGFNAGSNLEANAYAVLAMVNTFVATAAAAVTWIVLETLLRGKASMLGAVSGAVTGLVAVTPAAGFAGPMGVIVLGIVATCVCYFFVSVVKNKFGYDDSLDVFGIHCIGGIIGALGTGILVNPALGGAGVVDYSTADFAAGYAGTATQLWSQFKGVLVTVLWSGIGSAILYKIVDMIVGLRPTADAEREGLDLTSHGEAAYHP